MPADFLNDILLDDQPLPYDLSRINILMKFDLFAASLCGEIRAPRGIQDEEPAR